MTNDNDKKHGLGAENIENLNDDVTTFLIHTDLVVNNMYDYAEYLYAAAGRNEDHHDYEIFKTV